MFLKKHLKHFKTGFNCSVKICKHIRVTELKSASLHFIYSLQDQFGVLNTSPGDPRFARVRKFRWIMEKSSQLRGTQKLQLLMHFISFYIILAYLSYFIHMCFSISLALLGEKRQRWQRVLWSLGLWVVHTRRSFLILRLFHPHSSTGVELIEI